MTQAEQIHKLSTDMEVIVSVLSLLLDTATISIEETDPLLRKLRSAQHKLRSIEKKSQLQVDYPPG
jgi:hypothetical protein